MSDNFDHELQELKREIQELKEQLSKTGQSGQQDLKDFGGRLINQIEDMLRSSLDKAKQPVEKAGDYSKNLIEAGEENRRETTGQYSGRFWNWLAGGSFDGAK